MGQCLIFQCLSFPFTISPCKWPTPPVPGVSNSSPRIRGDETQNALSLPQNPRGIYEGCTTRTGPNSRYSLSRTHSPPYWFWSSPPLSQLQVLLPQFHPQSLPGRPALVGALYSVQEINVNMTPPALTAPTVSQGTDKSVVISVHSGFQGCGAHGGFGWAEFTWRLWWRCLLCNLDVGVWAQGE